LQERFTVRVFDTSARDKENVSSVSRFRIDKGLQAAGLALRLLRELVRFRPNLVHVNTPYNWALFRDGLFVLLARMTGTSTLLHFRGGDFPEVVRSSSSIRRLVIRAILSLPDRLLAVDRHTEAFLAENFGSDVVRYLPNFVQGEDFDHRIPRVDRDGNQPEVLYVGWILETKGIGDLLCAARALKGVRFTLVGPVDAEFMAKIREEIASLGDRVQLIPPQPSLRIREFYARADLFVLPSWREGFPNVILEAMAAGLPVVATTVGAIPDAVRHEKDGLLVPPRDTEALTAALERLVSDSNARKRMGESGKARVRENFEMDRVLERLAGIYDELLERRSSTSASD